MIVLLHPEPVVTTGVEEWPVNVGIASRLSGLTPKMVRHYEAQGLLGEIQRSGGGYRLYSLDDVQTLRFITTREPEFAGVDPYNKWIDRNSDDNLRAME